MSVHSSRLHTQALTPPLAFSPAQVEARFESVYGRPVPAVNKNAEEHKKRESERARERENAEASAGGEVGGGRGGGEVGGGRGGGGEEAGLPEKVQEIEVVEIDGDASVEEGGGKGEGTGNGKDLAKLIKSVGKNGRNGKITSFGPGGGDGVVGNRMSMSKTEEAGEEQGQDGGIKEGGVKGRKVKGGEEGEGGSKRARVKVGAGDGGGEKGKKNRKK